VKAASLVIVDLYRLVYNAGRPLSFDELVDGLPSAYQNDANRWWVAKEEAAGRPVPPDPWDWTLLRRARAEWTANMMNGAAFSRSFIGATRDGSGSQGRRRSELVYRPNRTRPPMVMADVTTRQMLPWTPEIGAAGRRLVRGVQFRDEWARLRSQSGKASRRDLLHALTLAAEALGCELGSV
jgi:hypothetical protein